MDCKLDIQSRELWGEDEIAGCITEIEEKIKFTLKMFLKITNDENLQFQMKNALYGDDEKMLYLIKIWQEQYRVEKMFYILSKEDRRNEVE